MTIPLFKVHVAQCAAARVTDVLASGTLTQGRQVEEFEKSLRVLLQCPRVCTVNSATSALQLALHLLRPAREDWPGLVDGDEVLTPALTCCATSWPVLHARLKPAWLDTEPQACCASLADVDRKLTARTKIVQVVHWGGSAVDVRRLDRILERAKDRLGFKPMVIEDCAHALGACYPSSQKRVGSSGNICVFSFQAIKLLTTGDGGCVVLPDNDLYERCRLLRWYGIDREARRVGNDFRLEEDVPEAGFKYHMNDYAAALGLANMSCIPRLLRKNREHASYLYRVLRQVEDIRFANYCEGSSFWLFTLLVERRDEFAEHMRERNITVSQVHKRNDTHSCVSDSLCRLPCLDDVEKRMVSVPVGWWLSADELRLIASTIVTFYGGVVLCDSLRDDIADVVTLQDGADASPDVREQVGDLRLPAES